MDQQQAMRFMIRNKERENQARREQERKKSTVRGIAFLRPVRKIISLLKA